MLSSGLGRHGTTSSLSRILRLRPALTNSCLRPRRLSTLLVSAQHAPRLSPLARPSVAVANIHQGLRLYSTDKQGTVASPDSPPIVKDIKDTTDKSPTQPPVPPTSPKITPAVRHKGTMTKSGLKIILSMFKYVWPKGDWATKTRVIAALVLMIGGKLANVQVPILFKDIVDTLNIDVAATGGTLSTIATAMLIGYGAARLGAAVLQELRNAIFANVQQSAIRNLALGIYRHLLNLDIQFHLSRETGGLTRAIDRGTKGISFILSSLVVHLVPTFLEIGMVSGILAYKFGPQYAVVTVATMAVYIVFTLAITQWRAKFRRNMNVADNQ
ncbi:Iron-sulfur clusters transporter atm1, mitochondrial, partial [Coemansia sp. RSA 2673]